MIAAVVFGVMGVAAAFSLVAFGNLAWRRSRRKRVIRDVYFWLAAGIAFLCLGLLEFAVVRTYQAWTHPEIPFVQNSAAALLATTLLGIGLTCFIRAKALKHPEFGYVFVSSAVLWTTITAIHFCF